jgi:3D (Asp-Asp-Asp) domain-containing protein
MKVGLKREPNIQLATFIFFALLAFYGVLLATADEKALAAAAEAAPAAMQGVTTVKPAAPVITAAQVAGFELPSPRHPVTAPAQTEPAPEAAKSAAGTAATTASAANGAADTAPAAVSTTAPTTGAALSAAKVTEAAAQGLKQTLAQAQESLALKAAQAKHGFSTIMIDKYGRQKEFTTSGKTVGEILKHLGITYEGHPIYPSPDTPAANGMVVHILGKFEKFEVADAAVPFTTRYVDNNQLPAGKDRVLQAGAPGKDKITYKYVLKDGYFQKIEIARQQEAAPIEAVIERGPKLNTVMTGEGAIPYKRRMVVEASAYTLAEGSGTGMTSIGIVPYEGIVAVDPDVIPYYTRMYIPGYGFAMAGDTGGAIIGNRVDLYMNDYGRAILWGRRDVEIYIL